MRAFAGHSGWPRGRAETGSGERRLIELFGLPGSGKTTVATGIQAELDEWAGLKQPTPLVYRGRHRLGRAQFQLTTHVRLANVAASGYRLARHGDRTAARRVPPLLVDVVRLRHASAQLESGDCCVLEQGPLQQLRSLVTASTKADDSDLDRLVAAIAGSIRPAARWSSLVVSTSATTATERIQDREVELGRFDRMTEEQRLAEFRLEETAQRAIVEALTRSDTCDVVVLDGELPPERVLADAVAAIQGLAG